MSGSIPDDPHDVGPGGAGPREGGSRSGGPSGGRRGWGQRANRAVHGMTSRVDGQTQGVAERAAAVIVLAVRVLRWPTLFVLVAPIPFLVGTLLLGLTMEGAGRVVVVLLALVGGLVSLLFGLRRRGIERAASVPSALATELGIAVSLSDRVDESRGVLEAVAGGGGWRVFSRMRGMWSGVTMTGRWIDGVHDLPRAKYFFPPTIGTTVTITMAALWLVPVSFLVFLFSLIAAVSRAL